MNISFGRINWINSNIGKASLGLLRSDAWKCEIELPFTNNDLYVSLGTTLTEQRCRATVMGPKTRFLTLY